MDEKLTRLIADANEQLDASEKAQVMAHIANAPFSDHKRQLQEWSRIGGTYVGLPHPSIPGQVLALTTDLDCAEWHATKHSESGEWAPGTTTQEYLDDIRASVCHQSSALDVGTATIRYRGSSQTRSAGRAGVRTEMSQVRSVVKKATPKPGSTMLTVYAVDTRKLSTAYQLETRKAMATVNQWANCRHFP